MRIAARPQDIDEFLRLLDQNSGAPSQEEEKTIAETEMVDNQGSENGTGEEADLLELHYDKLIEHSGNKLDEEIEPRITINLEDAWERSYFKALIILIVTVITIYMVISF